MQKSMNAKLQILFRQLFQGQDSHLHAEMWTR
jgi:hypothetical protein